METGRGCGWEMKLHFPLPETLNMYQKTQRHKDAGCQRYVRGYKRSYFNDYRSEAAHENEPRLAVPVVTVGDVRLNT